MTFHVTLVLGLTARLAAEMAQDEGVLTIGWFAVLLAWFVHETIQDAATYFAPARPPR